MSLFDNQIIGFFCSGLLWIILGYAEIHFRLPLIPSRLFKREPEIVFDVPFRGEHRQPLPLFLFIKDAHRFPVTLLTLTVRIRPEGEKTYREFQVNFQQRIQQKFHSQTILVSPEHFPGSGAYEMIAELQYQAGKKRLRMQQDNYPGIPHEPFRIYLSDALLPALPNCYWGDLHVHSNYTDDQVEFGAPVCETALCARAMGLHFIAITDHSYDLDDELDNYLKNDPALPKWRRFLEEAARVNRDVPDMLVLTGEEVSAGNHRRQNVHCLVLGSPVYIAGRGDGGEPPFSNRPTLSLEQLYQQARANGAAIIAAAHPFDKPPLAQQAALNRGYWHFPDLAHDALDYWQILNGRADHVFQEGLAAWTAALLRGQQIGILAGTDAHGNFNCYRQVAIPFFKIVKHRQQLLGQTRTGVFSETALNKSTLMRLLCEKRAIVSTGPVARLEVVQEQATRTLGDTIKAETAATLRISAASSSEFGVLHSITLYHGDIARRIERQEELRIQAGQYRQHLTIEKSAGFPAGYLRLVVYSSRGSETNFCLTNPIWIR